jgi:succinate dehydrogenase / fumarate reductase, cytochrome b subunit
MSTLTVSPSNANPGFLARNHFMLRRLHSLTGILFGSYLFVHLTVNATLAEGARHDGGATVFQQLVNYIHSLPFLIGVEWAMIFLPIIYHTFYGFYIIFTGQPNVKNYGYTRNWLYIFQRITAIVLVFFLLFHVLTTKGLLGPAHPLTFKPLAASESTLQHLQYAWWVWMVIYPLGVLSAAFHTANGFYAAGITWGLTVSRASQNRWGGLCVLIFGFLFVGGMTALIAGVSKTAAVVATLPQ